MRRGLVHLYFIGNGVHVGDVNSFTWAAVFPIGICQTNMQHFPEHH